MYDKNTFEILGKDLDNLIYELEKIIGDLQ